MSIIIGIDHGYYAIKTAHCSFPAGLTSYGEHEPYTRQGLLEFGGCFFVCGTGRQPIQRDKTINDNYYLLTLAAIAKEIRQRGLPPECSVRIAAGLPLTSFGRDKPKFKDYLLRSNQPVNFKFEGVESSVWHWKSRDIGGKSALKYLIYVEGVPFVEAVQLLCEESPTYIPVQHEAVERERPLFRLPNPALNNDRVTRYLLGRGISLPTIRYCIERKILYESAEYHNCVFLGKDPQGVPKYAALRGIYDYGKPFKREAPGSQKQYGFCIQPMQPGTTVAVFEAAIDAMAEMTLCGNAANKYRLSLGGVSSSGKEPLALQEFLRQHPEITTIELRLDNDAKGRMASVGIRKIYADRYTVHDLPPDIENGDYADMAKSNLMVRTAAHRAVPCR